MRATRWLLVLALVLCGFSGVAAANETFTIVVENAPNGRIFAQSDSGTIELGRVLVPCNAVNNNGFTASAWAPDSTVCATAVNAIHIKVSNQPETGRGIIFTIQPREFLDFDPANYGSYFSESASIFTDIPAGTGIFGGGFAPLVGSKVSVVTTVGENGLTDDSSQPQPMPDGFVPKEGDVFIITVERLEAIDYIEFDNSFGGLITLKRLGEKPEVIGQVLKPVAGVGRFGGSIYARVGRIRANHPGVICVSTSPLGEIGGFQIIPREHAMSPEMTLARTLTQWLVVGPIDGREPSWEGTAPLFFGYLYPSYIPLVDDSPELGEISALNRLLTRFRVTGRMRGSSEWGPLPTVTGRVDDALVDLGAIRIYFPLPALKS
ncbi:MAG: hypothetical protein A2Y63_00380 [Candidatus Riflebacteria bacterium RBG_13_59_9]|nr:MAG: hypothetical protein A2Y63_00380 [Candidatus Riflebacteria bacterium RBG_13_59_9]